MTTSGSYSYNPGRDSIIRRAARLVGAIASGEVNVDPATTQDFAEALNGMVKRWQSSGLHLWAEQQVILFPNTGQRQYGCGPNSTDNFTTVGGYVQTAVTVGASPGGTVFTVSSSTGIVATNFIGVQLAAGPLQWSTVSNVGGGGVLTILNPLTDFVLPGALVFAYATKAQRPLRMISGQRINFPSGILTPMNPPLARQDYFNLPNPTNTGIPTQYFYDPQLVTGQVYIWPQPPDPTNGCIFTSMRPLQDFLVAGDTPDFPQEWVDPLVYNLAYSMCPEFGVPEETYGRIKEQAAAYYDMVQGFDREPESVYVGVSIDRR